MRIYLACTVRGSREGLAAVRGIAARLQALGHEVLTTHLLDEDVDSREASLDARQVFDRDLGWLDACDALVAEVSGSSYGVGFEVGYLSARAPQTGQRVFLLYDTTRTDRVSRLAIGYHGASGRVVAYRDLAEVERFVDAEFGPHAVTV
jgi:nucleoside 2-deoxyribosyltransferase